MEKFHVYRNTAIEYLFKELDFSYSGYDDLTIIDENEDIIMFYFLPYKYDKDVLINFIDEYKRRIEYIIESYKKNIYVVSLYNYFYKSFVLRDNDVCDCVNEFNKWIKNNNYINALDIEDFYKCYKLSEVFDLKYYYLYNAIINPKYASFFKDWFIKKINKSDVRKKCLVVDLDNTLWGGILGEDGIENLHISGNYPGSAFNDFQRLLLNLKRDGVILAISSKNNYSDVEECFNVRDDLLLKLDDFTIKSINWNSKVSQINEIASKLNIGLDSIVFIDDNPVERESVKLGLPEVLVLDFPSEPYLMVDFYKYLFLECFSTNELNLDDLNKSKQYDYKIMSDELKSVFHNEEEFIQALNLKLYIQKMDKYNEQRIVQLINKTNQFNLTTKRYDFNDLKEIINNGGEVFSLKVIDKFGDLGITGVCIVRKNEESAFIDSFMLSCRILGRKIEDEFLKFVLNKMYNSGVKVFKAKYIRSNRNDQTKEFYLNFGFDVFNENENENEINYIYNMDKLFLYDKKYFVEEIL